MLRIRKIGEFVKPGHAEHISQHFDGSLLTALNVHFKTLAKRFAASHLLAIKSANFQPIISQLRQLIVKFLP